MAKVIFSCSHFVVSLSGHALEIGGSLNLWYHEKKIKLSKRTVTNKETIPKSLLRERLYRKLLTPINEMRSKFNVLQMAYLHVDIHNKKGFCQYSGQACLTVFLHNVQINFTIYYGFLQSFVFLQFVKKYLL